MKMYAMSVLLAGVLLLGYSLTGNYVFGSATQGRSSKQDTNKQDTNKRTELYDRACSNCHGRDGRGETSMGARLGVPDFTAPAWKKTASGKRLILVVTSGHERMPAFKDTFTKEEIKELVRYLRNFQR